MSKVSTSGQAPGLLACVGPGPASRGGGRLTEDRAVHVDGINSSIRESQRADSLHPVQLGK